MNFLSDQNNKIKANQLIGLFFKLSLIGIGLGVIAGSFLQISNHNKSTSLVANNNSIKDISNYKINIEIKSAQVKEKIIEVDTTLSLKPIKNDFELIRFNSKLG